MEKLKQFFSQAYYTAKGRDNRSQRIKALVLLALQVVFALKLFMMGVGAFPVYTIIFVIAFDLAALAIRAVTHFKADIYVCYVPPTIFSMGMLIQQALAITKQNIDAYLDDTILDNAEIALVISFVVFLFLDKILQIPEKISENGKNGGIASAKRNAEKARVIYTVFGILVWLVTIVIYALTLIMGDDNDAHLSVTLPIVGSVQLYEFLKLVFVIYNGYLLSSGDLEKGSKFSLSIAFLAVNAFFLVLMNEFGTLLVYVCAWLLTQIIFLSGDDVKDIFVYLGTKRRKLLAILVFILMGAAIVWVVEANADNESFINFIGIRQIHEVVTAVSDKYNRLIVPWVSGEGSYHTNLIKAAIQRGGAFGLFDITHINYIPEVKSDGIYSMVLHLFGWVGGLIFLLLVTTFSFHAVKSAASNEDEAISSYSLIAVFIYTVQTLISCAVAVGMLPLIGISLPLISFGGAGYVTYFVIIAIIYKSEYLNCQSGKEPEPALTTADTLNSFKDILAGFGSKAAGFFKSRFFKGLIAVVLLFALVAGLFGVITLSDFEDAVFDNLNYQHLQERENSPVEEVKDIGLFSDKKLYNVLVLGLDAKDKNNSQRSDVMMLVSFDMRHNTVKMLSFQRDSYVKIAGRDNKAKLNSAFTFGGKSARDAFEKNADKSLSKDELNKLRDRAYKAGGAQTAIETIENNFRVSIDDYFIIEFEGLKETVDSLDGIEINLSADEADYVNEKLPKESNKLSKGKNLLNGKQALTFARARHTSESDNDYNRTNRQSIVIKAMLNKCISKLKHLKIKELKEFAGAAAGMLTTSIDKKSFIKREFSLFRAMLPAVMSSDIDAIERYAVPNGNHYEDCIFGGSSCLVPQLENNAEYIRSVLKDKEDK